MNFRETLRYLEEQNELSRKQRKRGKLVRHKAWLKSVHQDAQQLAGALVSPLTRTMSTHRNRDYGRIYFVGAFTSSGKLEAVKIGFTTNDGDARLRDLQCACPLELRELATTVGTGRDELAMHQRFCQYHLRGEWFSPGEELLRLVEQLRLDADRGSDKP